MDEYKRDQEKCIQEILLNDLEISIIEKALLVFCRLHNEKKEGLRKNIYNDYAKPFNFDKEEVEKLDKLHNKFLDLTF